MTYESIQLFGAFFLRRDVTDPKTGVAFPAAWPNVCGLELVCLGAGCRKKAILGPIAVNVYSAALFVEAGPAAKELGVRQRGGLFADGRDAAYCDALLDGAFMKALHLVLVRSVSGDTFAAALAEALEPRLRLAGAAEALPLLVAALTARGSFDKGVEVFFTWRPDGALEVTVQPPADGGAGGRLRGPRLRPDAVIPSQPLCRALFEVFLGADSVVPDGRAAFAAGARRLLEAK